MMMDKTTKKNKLSECTSPYLQQHAENPVDWYPWCDEALQLAKQQNKPILLSIGYSACHWCHVMAHESFEDEETAELMNRYFINIKVDREERPDLDKVYQLSHQIITGRSGGWPLTVFLTPEDHMPFFIGTYFPKEPRYNLMTFKEILQRVHEFYLNHFDEIKKQNIQLNLAFKQLHRMPSLENDVLTNAALFNARHELEKEFDAQNGGFGDAPKFPQSLNLQRLLQHFDAHPKDTDAKNIVLSSLYKMALAGIFDHIGGGFFRYAVDKAWQIPHFEKMLYDNALLLDLYINAYRKFQINDFAEIAREICGWALREMCDNNGFYSTLDADSEKLEGKYYYWDREEIRTLLEDEEYQVMTYLFGFDHPANFEHHWHLTKRYTLPDLAKKLNSSEEKTLLHLKNAKQKLFNARIKRAYPHRDEKILTSWNALMITALIKAGFYLKEKTFSDAGLQTLSFIKNNLWVDTNLFACYKDGKVSQNAYLDDYAFLLEACLTSLQYHWDKNIFSFAQTLAEKLMTLFYDEKNHGFFFTSHEHENLIDRPKSFMDEALPAGNAIATLSLIRLGHLIGEIRYLNAGENSVKLILPIIEKYPFSHCGMLNALEECLTPPSIIILRGTEPELTKWRDKCLEGYHPHRFVLAIAKDEKDLPLCLAKYFASENDMTAYVCKGAQCLPPVYSWEELEKTM